MARPTATYRRPITIDHTQVTGTLTDFPLMLRITGSDATALLDKARWDGQDLTLTTSDGETVVPHVRHYAGKALVPDGVWCWFTEPRAVHCAAHGSAGITYIGIMGTDGDTALVAYDHSTGLSQFRKFAHLGLDDHSHLTVYVTGTGRILCASFPHGSSPITGYHIASTTGDINATSTTTTVTVASATTMGYPSYYGLSAGKSGPGERTFRLYYVVLSTATTHRDLYYDYSDDDGVTWSTPVLYATSGGEFAYAKHVSDGVSKIHIAVTDSHPGYVSANTLHHFVLESNAGTIKFYKSDGTEITATLPFDVPTEATLVYDSAASNLTYGTGALNWISGIELDGSTPKRPGICFATYPGATGPLNSTPINDSRYVRALWNGASFDLTEIARGGDNLPWTGVEYNYYAGVCLKQGNPAVAYVATNYNTRTASTNDGPHEIQEWTYSGGWSKTADVTQGSGKGATGAYDYEHFRPVWVRDAHADLQVIWCGGRYDGYTAYNTSLHGWPVATGEPCVYLTAKVPSINDSADTTLYLYYGNRDISADSQAAASSVLAANTKLFIPGGDYPPDSSKVYEIANGWRPPKTGSLIANPREVERGGGAKFFQAIKFDGAVDLPNNALFAGAISNSAKDFTLMGWVKFADLGATYSRQPILLNAVSSAGMNFRMRCYDGTAGTSAGTGHRYEAFLADNVGGGPGGAFFVGQTNIAANTWHFIALTFSSSDNLLRFYLNGVAASETYSAPTWHATASVAGQWGSDGSNFVSPGTMIERARFWSGDSTACLSAGRIATIYENESAPETFALLGTETLNTLSGSYVALEAGIRGLNRGIY